MHFLLSSGWITTAGFSCVEDVDTTTTTIPDTTTPKVTTLPATTEKTTTFPATTIQTTVPPETTNIPETTKTTEATTTQRSTTTTAELEPYQCQHLPTLADNSGWVCSADVNTCQLACNGDQGRLTSLERMDGDDLLPKVACRCVNLSDSSSCDYFIDDDMSTGYNVEELSSLYSGACNPVTTPAPTTRPTLVEKCGELPEVEVGFWSCQDTVCVLDCPDGQIQHINLALQCLCLTEDDHCTFIKVQPSWLTDVRRFDFALGFETRDGFKCKQRPTTTPVITTTAPPIQSCDSLPLPGLPWGSWVCSVASNYCTFTCPENFKRNKTFNIKCKCTSKKCYWVKQNPIALDITSFTLGWLWS